MKMRRLRQAFAAVVIPATLVGATVAPAHAAKAPKVPSPAKVAAVYPHLAGVTPITVSGAAQGTTCTPASAVKGVKSTSAVYTATAPSSTTPSVTVAAARFKAATKAKAYLKKAMAAFVCEMQAMGFTATATPIKFKLKGTDQRVGFSAQSTMGPVTIASQAVFARKGNKIVSVSAASGDAVVPALAPELQLLKVAVKTAR